MDLERRLAYYLPRLEATMAAAESAVAELERAQESFAPARWFGAYLAAQDALALHVTGEVRGAATLENFKYRDARLVEARYYSDAKTYSGEAEDDANEALRRLAKVLDEQPSKQLRRTVERLGLALDGLLARKDDVARGLKRSEAFAVAALGRGASCASLYPREELRGPGSLRWRRGDALDGGPAPGRLKRRRRDSDSSDDDLFEGDLGALKSAAGADAAALASSRDRADDEAARAVDEPERAARRGDDGGDEYADFERLEAAGDWATCADVAGRALGRALADECDVDVVVGWRRARARALARLGRGDDAALELAAALRAAERAGLADEEERCHVDAGLNWLALAQGAPEPRARRDAAAKALVEFETCRGLCEAHGFTDALGRARHNAGLAFLEVPDLGAAAREFAAARATFEAVLARAGKG